MKHLILSLLSTLLMGLSAIAHGDVELGPNGGRILEFSKNESMHGEVLFKDNQFHISLLDAQMKPVAISEQELTATTADRSKPEKLTIEKKDGSFLVPAVKPGDWIIFQFRETQKAKPITARLQYDTSICSACKEPEWLCKCAKNKDATGKK